MVWLHHRYPLQCFKRAVLVTEGGIDVARLEGESAFSAASVAASAIVRRVPDGDPELLRYLAELGIVPTEPVVVISRAPFDGPLTVEVGGRAHALSPALAQRILVDGPG